uniref:Uncharacterized protein n=1 Tax=Arundo donax TaxID=35708 RepID=A0A0A9GYE5_ARUDO
MWRKWTQDDVLLQNHCITWVK